jgi:putative ABC transport system ATP-binding protein
VLVEGVVKRFDEHVTALRGLDLDVSPGELLLLRGPSGAGKSTLLNLVAGFDQPDAGRIVVAGQDLADLEDPARFRREVVGVVFQLHHLIAGLTAEENVELALIPGGGRRRERLDRARSALTEVGLEHRRTHLPSQMSGGERQRVALARALVGHPRVLLADEPTGALDSEAGRETLALLAARSREHGMTVLLVSHEPVAAAYADRIERIVDGRICRGQGGQLPGETLDPGTVVDGPLDAGSAAAPRGIG